MKAAHFDPFRERRGLALRRRYRVLGCELSVVADDPRLLALTDAAVGGLPWRPGAGRTPFQLTLRLAPDAPPPWAGTPPPVRMSSGAGWLCGIVDGANYVLVCPAQRTALVSISTAMLRFAYHARYELIEFAVLTLLARGMNLVPLHAACFGLGGSGALLIGDSGAGKSTLCAQALRERYEFLSEDSVFVAPASLSASGIASYIHLQRDSLRFLRGDPLASRAQRSPVIRRRSGARKFEVDLRDARVVLARERLALAAVIVLSTRPAGNRHPLLRLPPAKLADVLAKTQPYAAGLPGWDGFLRRVRELPAYELRRTAPHDALAAIRDALSEARP